MQIQYAVILLNNILLGNTGCLGGDNMRFLFRPADHAHELHTGADCRFARSGSLLSAF